MNEGCLSKIYLRWDRPWWRHDHLPWINVAWNDAEAENVLLPEEWTKGVFSFDDVLNHDDILICWVTADCGRIADSLSDDEVSQKCDI